MYRLRWTITDSPDADWEECLYHEIVRVKGGIATTSDPLTVDILVRRGFELIEETAEA